MLLSTRAVNLASWISGRFDRLFLFQYIRIRRVRKLVVAKKRKRNPTSKQVSLVKGVIAGKTIAQAAREAGYSITKPENAGQAGYQALKQMGDAVRNIMDQAGFTLAQLIDKDLRSVIEAKETKFFPWRKVTKRKTEQIIEQVETVNLSIRATGLDIAFKLRGDYAPKKVDFDPDAGAPIRVINLGRIPRYND